MGHVDVDVDVDECTYFRYLLFEITCVLSEDKEIEQNTQDPVVRSAT